ncbi:MAG: c-type cytochrome [Betaproteobacteria bacterium]|nr:c-type cytochrome [Betaproteobacteria bacterium]
MAEVIDMSRTISTWRWKKILLAGAAALLIPTTTQAANGANGHRSGKEVVETVCARCHATGLNGAPEIGDEAAWSQRAAQGLTALTKHAIDGIRNMPPHGGSPGVSDFELELAITYMVNHSGGHWARPLDKASVPVERSGEQIVHERCIQCHGTGFDGAPKIGDRAAWIPRLRYGLEPVVRSAIRGHGPMPPRGGMADLTDAEIRGAIIYMVDYGTPAAK